MPSWLLLTLCIAACTLVVPLYVVMASGGKWRQALKAWRAHLYVLGALAVPGILAALAYLIWPPRP